MSLFNNRDRMWFGTFDSMRWIETPNTGADVSPTGFGAESTLLNGGGYARNSWDSHKRYQFSWGESASPELASVIHGYANGSFGRGLILFNDPMYYSTNLLPKRWADPSMAVNFEAEGLYFDQSPRSTPAGVTPLGLPAMAAIYEVPGFGSDAGRAITIPVPPGFTVGVGVHGAMAAGSGVMYQTTGMTGPSSGFFSPLAPSGSTLINYTQTAGGSGGSLVLHLRNNNATSQVITLNAMTVRMAPPGEVLNTSGPWMSGEGHSGCRFVGKPTLINYNGVNGGQVGLTCTLKETGAWE